MGARGLQLLGKTQFPVGTELEVHFGQNGQRAAAVVTMRAAVQHSHPEGMLIGFIGVRPSEQTKTFSTIRQLAGRQKR